MKSFTFIAVLLIVLIKRYSTERCCFALSDSIFSQNQSLIQDVPMCAAEIVGNAIRDNPTLDKKGLLELIGHGVYDNEGRAFDFTNEKNADKRNSILVNPQPTRNADNTKREHYVEDMTIYGQNTTGMISDSEKLIQAMNSLIETAMVVINKEAPSGKSTSYAVSQQDEPVYFNIHNSQTDQANNSSEKTLNVNTTTSKYTANGDSKYPPTNNNIILINNIQYPNGTKTEVQTSGNLGSSVNLAKNTGPDVSRPIQTPAVALNRNKETPQASQQTSDTSNVHFDPNNRNHDMLSNTNIKPLIAKADNPKKFLQNIANGPGKPATVNTNSNQNFAQANVEEVKRNTTNNAQASSNNSVSTNTNQLTEKKAEKEPMKFCLYRKPKASSVNTTNFYFVGKYNDCINNCARGVCDIIPPAQIVKLWSGKKQPLDSDMVSICVTKRIYDIGSHCTKIGARNMLMKMLSMEHYLNQPGNAYMIEIFSMYGGFFPDNKNLIKGTYLTKHIDSFIEVLNQANHFLTFHNILRCKRLLRTFSETVKATIASLMGFDRREVYKEVYNEVRKTLVRLGLGQEIASQNWLDNLQCQILNQDNF